LVALGEESASTVRCQVQLAYLRAMSGDKQQRETGVEQFARLRDKAIAHLPSSSVARAELMIMESEIMSANGMVPQALVLARRGREAYQKATGRSFSGSFHELH